MVSSVMYITEECVTISDMLALWFFEQDSDQ